MNTWPQRLAGPLRISRNFARKLVSHRHLIWNFTIRDLKSRYVGSLMGFFWAVIHPLVLLLSYTFVFAVIFKARLPEPFPDNFALFLFAGILPWLYFQDTLSRASTCVVDNGNLIRKTVFPSEILPVTLVLSNLLTHLVGLLILLAVLVTQGWGSGAVIMLPLYIGLLSLLTLGLGWFFAAAHVFFRDTAQLLSVGLVLWFWFTPIFYQMEQVPEPYRSVLRLNPLSLVVDGYRDLLLLGQFPAPGELAALTLVSVVIFVLGGSVFRLLKREFVDVL